MKSYARCFRAVVAGKSCWAVYLGGVVGSSVCSSFLGLPAARSLRSFEELPLEFPYAFVAFGVDVVRDNDYFDVPFRVLCEGLVVRSVPVVSRFEGEVVSVHCVLFLDVGVL